jgi:sugar-specific transcriptional regulator TrmB
LEGFSLTLTFEERLNKLKEFGLTEYQARAYLALLELNTASANKIPAMSRVPRTKIYGIMRQLHDKGLVQIIPESPLKYKAVPFNKFLKRRVSQLKEEADELNGSIEKLTDIFKLEPTVPEEQGKFEMFYGRRNVRNKLRDLYSNAKKSVVSIGNEHSPGRIIRTSVSIIEDLSKSGVKIEYGFPVNKQNISKIERLAEYAEVKNLDRKPSMHFIIVDSEECLLVHRIPDDEDPIRGEDIAIWSNDKAIVNSMKDYAEELFEDGLNYKTFNLIKPAWANITNWLSSLKIDYNQYLSRLGEELGMELSKKFKSNKIKPLLKEMAEFWEKNNLGTIKILKQKPLEITLENHMDCMQKKDIVIAQCSFIKNMLGTILEQKLGMECTVQEVDCRPEHSTYCKFRLNLGK